jgi:hypothetical protein
MIMVQVLNKTLSIMSLFIVPNPEEAKVAENIFKFL